MRSFLTRTYRQIGLVSLATLASTLLPLLAVLWIARQVEPAVYGSYASWLAGVAIASVVLGLRLDASVPLEPEGPRRRRAVRRIALLIALLGGTVAALTGVAGTLGLLDASTTGLGLAAAFAALLMAWSSLGQVMLGADGDFQGLARYRLVQAIGLAGLQIAAVSLSQSLAALVLAYVAGLMVGLFSLPLRLLSRADDEVISSDLTEPVKDGLVAAALDPLRRHRRFALYSMPSALIGSAAEQMPLLLVGSRFGDEAAGFFGLAKRALDAAIGVAMMMASDWYRRSASQAIASTGECRKAFDQVARWLTLYAALLVAAVLLGHDVAFSMVFGKQWEPAGLLALLLVPVHALKTIASPLSQTFFFAGRQPMEATWQAVLLLMSLVPWWLGADMNSALLLYVVPVAVWYAVYLAGARSLTRRISS